MYHFLELVLALIRHFHISNLWIPILAEHFKSILGKKAKRDIQNDEQLNWQDFE